MRTLLVTGALGTLGRWTIDELAGEYEIVGLDLQEPERSPYETVEYLATDLTEQGPVWEVCLDVDPDVVVHLAAVPGAGHRAGGETFVHNVASTYNVLTAAGEVGADVIWSSSEATYARRGPTSSVLRGTQSFQSGLSRGGLKMSNPTAAASPLFSALWGSLPGIA
jgi:UDP-glucose 4-epimerase